MAQGGLIARRVVVIPRSSALRSRSSGKELTTPRLVAHHLQAWSTLHRMNASSGTASSVGYDSTVRAALR